MNGLSGAGAKTFADFEIWVDPPIDPTDPRGPLIFPVRVINSPDGPATGRLALDIGNEEFNAELATVRGIEPNLELRQSFGQRLFKALFHDQVRDRWTGSLGRIDQGQADGLRLRLTINVPQLASLPWELLWDKERGFLATAANQVVSRYLPVPEPPHLPAQERLKILLVVESPPGLPSIDQIEVDNIKNAIQALGPVVDLQPLYNPPAKTIQSHLQKDYHVLHFLGHGASGELFLTSEDGKHKDPIDDQAFAQLFQGRRTLRVVVLNACNSCQAGERGLFSGIGPALVHQRMPAVIAMQYPFVQLDTAGRFSERFYGALANDLPVDVAVNEARQFLSAGVLLAERDWSTPVLYMGTRSGKILNFRRGETGAPKQAGQALQATSQETGKTTFPGVPADLSQKFEEVAIRSNRLQEWLKFEGYLRSLQIRVEQLNDVVTLATRSLPVFRQDTIDSLQWAWDQLCQATVIELKSFGRNVQYISRAIAIFPGSKPNPEFNKWFSELDRLEKGLKDALPGNLTAATAEPTILLNELIKQCRGFLDHLRDGSADCEIFLQREAEVLVKLATLLHTQLRA